jgi:cell division protein ZapE
MFAESLLNIHHIQKTDFLAIMTTPIERYHQDLQRGFIIDAAQKNIVQQTQQLYEQLVEAVEQSQNQGWLAKLIGEKIPLVPGIYLWGGVGRGKTYLIDSFYDSLPFPQKMRIHFHRFMRQIHLDLKTLQNTPEPLTILAKRLAKKVRVICLDEFHVADITDAMLLSGLLKALFVQKVTLVATSNVAPDDLYQNGFQRDRFSPAIALIKQHTKVIKADSEVDYRLRALEKAEVYHYPLDDKAELKLQKSFQDIAPDNGKSNVKLEINGRYIPTRHCADGIAWFDFQELCNIPRSVADYIELSRCFNTVIISNIMAMDDYDETDNILRLINLVDEFYDRNVKLIISAEVSPEQLYTGRRHTLPFQRTASRLKEMGSHAYLERPHLP